MVTQTETEALLLEANLIKRLKPRFNILLRDDKSFPYILIRKDHPAPQLLKHRGARKTKGDYFGPFASVGAVNQTLNTLQKAFLIRTCTDSVYEGRSRPLHALPDQALVPGPVSIWSNRPPMTNWSRRRRTSCAAAPTPCARNCRPA